MTKQTSGRKKKRKPRSGLFGMIGLLFVLLLLTVFSISSFIQGKPLTGKSSNGANRDFRNYGEGAFSVDHVSYLIGATWTLVLFSLVLFLILNRKTSFYDFSADKALKVIKNISLMALYVAHVVAISLLVSYQVAGIPFRNFQGEYWLTHQGLGYALAYILPLFSLGLLIFLHTVIVKSLKKPSE